MSPTLNIKPNQCLIIDAIAFYTGVPLVQRGFLHYCIFEVKVSGHDSHSLLFGFLDWWTQEVCKRERRNGELDQVGQLWLLRGAHRTTKCQSKPQLSVWWACASVCVLAEGSLWTWASVTIAQEWLVMEKMVTHNALQWLRWRCLHCVPAWLKTLLDVNQ